MSKTALIAGGTGLVGRHLVGLLVETKEFDEIKVLVRKGSTHKLKGVSVIELDYDQLSDAKSQLGAEVVFCCLGTTMKKAGSKEQFHRVDFTYPYELATLSLNNGSQQFNIITAAGANANSMFFYNRVKGEVEIAISKLGFHNINIFRPSLLLGQRDDPRIAERIGAAVAKGINPLLFGSFKKHRAIEAETVARAMVNVSLENRNGIQVISSDALQDYGKS